MFTLLLPAALAWDSPAQEVFLSDETNLYEAISFDSGWLPNGSPVSIAIRVVADGGSYVEMEGESWLEWPPSLTHGYEPYLETGYLVLDSVVGIEVALKVDAGGIYYEDVVYQQKQPFEAEALFSPWLLDDGSGEARWAEASATGAQAELFNQQFNIYTGVSVYVASDWRTDASAGFTGVRFTTNGELIEQEGGFELFAPPEDGLLLLDSVFTGRYRAGLDLVMIPRFGVCLPILGCTDIAAFELPIPMVDAEFDKDFQPMLIEHGLPVAFVDPLSCNFGEVEIGEIAHCEIALSNLGEFDIEGTAGILGAEEFSVFPGDILARADTSDGLTVTFAPTVEGVQESALILNTSDPSKDALSIPLVGMGVSEELTVINTEVGGCGCSSTPKGASWSLAGLLGLLVLRRRRS